MASSKVFHHKYIISLRDTDAAGVLFSGNLVAICHIGYEAMMTSLNMSLASVFKNREYGLPVVHTECDFRKPLTVSDEIDIAVSIAEVGKTSYRVKYECRNRDGEICATASIVHVCIEANNYKPQRIPAQLRSALENYLES